jgi:metal-responsive CopG/Arc/MetJ family transcriptional regulator
MKRKRAPGAGRPKEIPGELIRTSIYLPEQLMQEVDKKAGKGNRSQVIREALERWLQAQ